METVKNPFSGIEDQLKKLEPKMAPLVIFKLTIGAQSYDVPVSLN